MDSLTCQKSAVKLQTVGLDGDVYVHFVTSSLQRVALLAGITTDVPQQLPVHVGEEQLVLVLLGVTGLAVTS